MASWNWAEAAGKLSEWNYIFLIQGLFLSTWACSRCKRKQWDHSDHNTAACCLTTAGPRQYSVLILIWMQRFNQIQNNTHEKIDQRVRRPSSAELLFFFFGKTACVSQSVCALIPITLTRRVFAQLTLMDDIQNHIYQWFSTMGVQPRVGSQAPPRGPEKPAV